MKNYNVLCFTVDKGGLQSKQWFRVVQCCSKREAQQVAVNYYINILGLAYCRPLKVVEDLPELEVAE